MPLLGVKENMGTLATPTADTAWLPLLEGDWDADTARHLLRRAGWTAAPADVQRAQSEGLSATLDRLFPQSPALFPEPQQVARFAADVPLYASREKQSATPEAKRLVQRERREHAQTAVQDMSLRWLQYASRPSNAAFAKWVLFLSDIYVVGFDKVQQPHFIYRHFDIISRAGLGAAPELSMEMAVSPAMMIYLDLNQNRRDAPNENFARELFELFLLGEGNYTENDVKEAARAFTGYHLQIPTGDVSFVQAQHDSGRKTIFGHAGDWKGGDVIKLAYGLPAAGAFVPHEMVKFYLSDTMLHPDYLSALGDRWRTEGGYNLRWLAHRFFGSRLFYASEFRGEFIKSPIQFYLGLVQDLDLDVVPVPRLVLNPLRQMGQVLFTPPNVRGWVGGRSWINSASLAARRSMVELLFNPIDGKKLNADEQADLAESREAGGGQFTIADSRLGALLGLPPDEAVSDLETDFLPVSAEPEFSASLSRFVGTGPASPERARRMGRAAMTLLQSPEYQLC